MAKITVQAKDPYEVLIDEVGIQSSGDICRSVCGGSKALIVSDDNVAQHYAGAVAESFATAGYQTQIHEIASGEASKNPAVYLGILKQCIEFEMDRSDVVIALGGGVVGDVAGFAASTYMRGCKLMHIPTSLLACVDSSVGGKTAIDFDGVKNIIGSFYQPNLVLIDTQTLKTLPRSYFRDGCAEVIKYGAIADRGLLKRLEQELAPDDSDLTDIITRCVQLKSAIVANDEREKGTRKLLNFGHTIGHAIESLTSYGIAHGNAVACGMSMITCRAHKDLQRALTAHNLPTSLDECGYGTIDASSIARAVRSDKKRTADRICCVLLPEIGHPVIKELTFDELEELISASMQTCGTVPNRT